MRFLKNKIALVLVIVLTSVSVTFAATTTEIMNGIALGAIIATLFLILIVCLVLLRAFGAMAKLLLPKEEAAAVNNPNYELVIKPGVPKITFWQKVLSLRPLAEEKELLIMHDYDDIQELDNPIPAWFNWLFYGSVVFGIVYLLNFHVFKLGKLQDEEYVVEMKIAAEEKEAFLAQSADRVDETTVKINTDIAVLESGKALFAQNCVACHGANGEGTVGPNLTDEYWLHGGSINNVFKTIKYGVPEKGMISWEKQLSPKQISDVSNYIESLKGTNPANPKAPQGEKE
ncbi:cbb3-type cytochrome c oxidase N-terminal domain-containing protein [Pedobacter alpinus]|uniref:Cbb3-type cytochrome c oxidase N-terminal domain-containing protein n=1 Tax=Pedobacter alpinus TaxID=1590643 RepID=A0ABW5TRP9_9SPHI